MIDTTVPSKHIGRILTCLILLVSYRTGLMAQDHGTAEKTAASESKLHVTHILGFEGISNNANGDLSIQGDTLRFQKSNSSSAQIPIASIQEVSLGGQDRQVGGVPMMLAKSAAPYGGGRVVSLFSHKKYDFVTFEYFDSNGALHGAIFQLNKGQGEILKSELEAAGAQITRPEDETTKAALPSQVLAGSTRSAGGAQWSVQVDKIEPGNVEIGPTFKVAIYENLVKELAKTKQFEQVLRYGDRKANDLPDLLILKTTVEAYTEGSETRRAVTTVSGFTKIKVRSQLCTREGKIVLERELNGNVRFYGGNLRATHDVAHNEAKAIKKSKLPENTPSAS